MNQSRLDLMLDQMEAIEAPLSNEFWNGVGIGFAIIAGVAGIAVIAT